MRLVVRVIALSFPVFLSIRALADTLTGKVVKITEFGQRRYRLTLTVTFCRPQRNAFLRDPR